MNLPLHQRKELLSQYFKLTSSQGMTVVPWKEGNCDLQDEMKKSLAVGCEGLILKKLDSFYDPGGRTSKNDDFVIIIRKLVKIKSRLFRWFRRFD